MPNTTPIPELQAAEIIRRLQGITEANGFNFTVSSVGRANKTGTTFEYGHLSIRVDQAERERLFDEDCSGNPPAIAWKQNWSLKCFCRNSNTPNFPSDAETDEPYKVNVNEMTEAVALAIVSQAADVSMWHTMGGTAYFSRVEDVEAFDTEDGEFHGAAVVVCCYYRVSETNPFEIRA